jgi:hypothetical protein
MSDTKKKPGEEAPPKKKPGEEALDRQAYFREIRAEMLKKLGLPSDTKPENVLGLLQLQHEMDKINSKRKKPS